MPDPSGARDAGGTRASDSAVPRGAEQRILELAGQLLGVELRHLPRAAEASRTLPDGARVDIDGYCPDPLIYAEVVARQGTSKSGQVHKAAQDVLKPVTIRRCLAPNARLYMVFADQAAVNILHGRNWLAEAARVWKVETLVVDLDPPLKLELQQAQRQRMTNPT